MLWVLEQTLQPLVQTMVRQLFHCSPRRSIEIHLQPVEDTHQSRRMQEGGCDPMASPHWSRFGGWFCDPVGDPSSSSLFQKACTLCEGPMVE
ncbi:hypothetical protein DUI87_10439 [Hirundo rustica rustica]|uniref:Uncharacterized protein n=1 Tax=Hirundo rustica rustica TaxID=333673 RepID=A0A3M0KI56_HIRRU|nr:hypothetical protein DUI87_10439 [Hirundo rustica rustica]